AAARAVTFGIPIALLVAAAGGYLLARKALEPVTRMSVRAREIGAGTLDQRVPVVNERDELGFLALTLNDLLERLQRAFESQKHFMADASHELRTPVSIIQGEADVALTRTDRDASEYRESIEVMRRAALNLTRIVQNLFLLARSDAGTYPVNKSRFYLDEALVESARAMRSAAFAKQIALVCDCPPEQAVFADEELVRRLFLNLIENAVKFTPEGGAVSVRSERDAGVYRIEVRDTGPGIAPEDQRRIFERFFRADRARRRVAGAGLGLSIAKWIAEIHGGSLTLQSSDQSGTSFVVVLPAESDPAAERLPSHEAAS
ncbi:MAG TPA: HAMP domain-containing sensor histidine kinase, partial [Thermoanaerobaculia bacterium]